MGFHNLTKTELVLELRLNSISSMTENVTNLTKKPNPSSDHPFQPCLTLALSGDSCGGATVCSSFSNSSVKRERDQIANEESERVENTSGEEDEGGGVNGKKKLRLTKAQSGLLEKAFKLQTALNPQTQKQELARDLKLRPRQVEVWFQNRRARTKLKQTEVDCEYLKKCCKTLTDENQRLRQEVQQLKAQKVSQPPFMVTLTKCPSCEKIEDTNSGTTSSPFTMAQKPYYLNPFTSSSAAC